MPLGDSITDGIGSQAGGGGGYRVELFRQAVADGHDITFVGTRPANGPNMVGGQAFPRNHEGLSGDSIQGTAGRAANAIPSTTPDIILLHIGTNNLGGNGVPQAVPGQLASLVDQIIEDAPDALLVVAQLIPTTQAQRTTNTMAYNATIPGLVQSRAAQGKHVVLVNMFDAFTSNPGGVNPLMNDFLHPNVAGYVVMAQTWYDAIESFLPGD
jgi:lysophospholipase L1-like esterase